MSETTENLPQLLQQIQQIKLPKIYQEQFLKDIEFVESNSKSLSKNDQIDQPSQEKLVSCAKTLTLFGYPKECNRVILFLYDRLLEIPIQELSESPANQKRILQCIILLSECQKCIGQYSVALKNLQKHYNLHKSTTQDSKLLKLLYKISLLYLAQSQFDEVDKIIQEMQKIPQINKSAKYQGRILYLQGCCQLECGELEQSVETLTQSFSIFQKQPKSDLDLSSVFLQLGKALYNNEQYEEALQNQKNALEIRRNYIKIEAHALISECLTHVGLTQLKLKQFKEAISYLDQSLQLSMGFKQQSQLQLADNMIAQAILLENLKDKDNPLELQQVALKQMKFLKQSIQTYKEIFGYYNCKIAYSLLLLSQFTAESGNTDLALDLVQESIKIIHKLCGEESPTLIKYMQGAANICYIGQLFDLARSYYEQALQIAKIHNLVNKQIQTFKFLAIIHRGQKLYKESLQYYMCCEELLKESYQKSPQNKKTKLEYSECLNNIGYIMIFLERYNESLTFHQNSFQLVLEIYGQDNINTALGLDDIVLSLTKLKKFNQAKEQIQKSIQIKEKLYGNNNKEIVSNLWQLEQIYSAEGSYQESIQTKDRLLQILKKQDKVDEMEVIKLEDEVEFDKLTWKKITDQPTQIFNVKNPSNVKEFMDKCSICLQDWKQGDIVRSLLPCFHKFHKECIDNWLFLKKSAMTCPFCRHEICKKSDSG